MRRVGIAIAYALVALGVLPSFALSNAYAVLPLYLRDHPWPLEVLALHTAFCSIVLARAAFREKKHRAIIGAASGLSIVAALFFVFYVNVALRMVPAPPTELRVGSIAGDFTLPDESGKPVTLSSLRGQKTLLVFYRGHW
jgi:hypothetical protein